MVIGIGKCFSILQIPGSILIKSHPSYGTVEVHTHIKPFIGKVYSKTIGYLWIVIAKEDPIIGVNDIVTVGILEYIVANLSRKRCFLSAGVGLYFLCRFKDTCNFVTI